MFFFFFVQAEDGIRDLVRSRGLGDVYKRQVVKVVTNHQGNALYFSRSLIPYPRQNVEHKVYEHCLLYTSDAADERSSVDLGGRRIIKKQNLG